jgi:ArsR family metal-binding transcriptional regulator
MADYVLFPNEANFEQARRLVMDLGERHHLVDPPEFCHGLISPAFQVSGGTGVFIQSLRAEKVRIAGTVPVRVFNREIPDAPPPETCWTDILGDLRISSVIPSLTDPLKLGVEIEFSRNIGAIIPLLPTLIKGGAFIPGNPVFTFDEEHRLVCVSDTRFIFSRVNDLLDLWIILRSAVDLLVSAWKRRAVLTPCAAPRYGIGAIEIYRRLPGTNCGECGSPNCMEFATRLFTRKAAVGDCGPLKTPARRLHLASLKWLLRVIGVSGEA